MQTTGIPNTAISIAQEVRAGRRSATDVVEESLRRIAAADPVLQAVEVLLSEQARADATALDARIARGEDPGPLAGVPVAVKAENDIAGVVTSFGGYANADPARQDSEVVRRLREAGAVVVATTTMPEFGQFPFTEGAVRGITTNPWDRSRTPGGSSGGSAALVAAGCVPVAIGGDGGGSIRIPASCCGLVGLKPLSGRVSTAPHPDLWGPLGTIGPLTRTVADTALVYDSIRGSTRVDRYSAPEPAESFLSAASRHPRRLRIGVITRPAWPEFVDRRVFKIVRAAGDALAEAGHDVVRLSQRWPNVQSVYVPLFYAALRAEAHRVQHPERLHPLTEQSIRAGAWAHPLVRLSAIRRAGRLAKAFRTHFEEYDVLLTPTLACAPPSAGRLSGVGATRALRRSMPMAAFTTLANVTGTAAISVPAGRIGEVPVGVMFSSPGGDESELLALSAQWESLRPWPLVAPGPV